MELQGSGAEPLEAGDPHRIGPIPLAGRLGAGGMGRVYLGVHEGRYVAVKQLLSSVVGEDEDFLRRFGHELDNISRLPPRATAPLVAGDRTARPPWFATAYVPGLTLRQAVEAHGGPLPAQALWLLLREVAAGLAPVHELDMVHRDLKPSNIMLTLDGLTLIDFGIARAAEQSQLTRTGMVVGTPAYMAPEQASGSRRLSGATDVFALGSVLAYAACGQPPFGDESGHGVLYRIVHEEPDLGPLRELEPDLTEIVAACLDKDPEGRPTAAELLERATRQGPFATPLWPRAVTERLSERAAFAAEVQAVDTPTVPLIEGDPEPKQEQDTERESKPETEPERTPGVQSRPGAPERPERRRSRVFVLPVLAVVAVGGTTLAIQYLPYASPPRAEAQATPSAPAPAPDGPTPPRTSGAPAGAASPGASPRGGKPGGDAGSEGRQGAAGSRGAGAGGTVTGTQGGPGTSASSGTSGDAATSGTPTGSGASGTSGVSGGAGGSGGSGTSGGSSGSGGVTPAPAPPPASGTYRYRNGDNGSCITQVYGAADHRDCADSTARWTVRSGSDGSFKLVNEQTGQCLYSNGLGQAVFVGDCAQNAGRLWRTGTGGSLRSDYGGGCLDLGMSSGLVTRTCAGEASQRWTKQT